VKTFLNTDINDLSDYMFFHNTLDEFIWLIKLAYAPIETIKSKKYSINSLYQYFITNTNIEKLEKIISPAANNPTRFIYFLKQGWYNELAAAYPFNSYQDDIGTKIGAFNDSLFWQTELFPSWTIIKTYYSIYGYYNSLIFTNANNLNTYRHRNPTNHFNRVLLEKFL